MLLHAAPALFLAARIGTSAQVGLAGERVAARHLKRLGMRILARRLHTVEGELDLVCAAGGTLVVVEVKTGRSGPRFTPGGRLGHEATRARCRAARSLAMRLGWSATRFDLLEVRLSGDLRWPAVVHHPGPAFDILP